MTDPAPPPPNDKFLSRPMLVSILLSTAFLIFAYTYFAEFGTGYSVNPIRWVVGLWSVEADNEHGWLVIPLIALMIYQARDKIAALPKKIDMHGLWLFVFGLLLYLASFRVGQPRVALGALPVILLGASWYLAGGKVAKLLTFPLLFFWLSIPLPAFQHSTVGLQIIATQLGHWGASLFGIDTFIQGTNLYSVDGGWGSFSISGGCSGMRSLMALIMISAAWAYLAPMRFWKKCVLFLSAVPLAVIGNGIRITSIVFMAEYVNGNFASKTWHDWSGLVFFFPVCLVGLAAIQSALTGDLSWLPWRKKKTIVRINNPAQKQP